MRLDDLVRRIAEEFGLGTPVYWENLGGGGPEVIRIATPRGDFVTKPVYRPFEAQLYAHVERALNATGIRQPRLLLSRSGAGVSDSGHCVLEWLPGAIHMRPSAAQSEALFRHLATYDAALAEVPVPRELDAPDSVFTCVTSPRYLMSHLPELLRSHAPAKWDRGPVRDALGVLRDAMPDMARLPTQLVHGDVGPDNVLYDGDTVVAVIDFTPHHQPVLFGVCTALYWYHVYAHQDSPDLDRIHGALRNYADQRPWTDLEGRLWPAMLLREALRRLATPFALAEESGRVPAANAANENRYRAVGALLRITAAK